MVEAILIYYRRHSLVPLPAVAFSLAGALAAILTLAAIVVIP